MSETPRAVVLVEGVSDQAALEALAARRGRDLDADRISIVPIGGAQAIGGSSIGSARGGLRSGWRVSVMPARRATSAAGLERAGLGSDLTRGDMERLGFYVCDADLEDELIRALGAAAVGRVIDAEGRPGVVRTSRSSRSGERGATEEQLRRFMGSGGSRKIRYARLLVDALDLGRVPRPLDLVLAHV